MVKRKDLQLTGRGYESWYRIPDGIFTLKKIKKSKKGSQIGNTKKHLKAELKVPKLCMLYLLSNHLGCNILLSNGRVKPNSRTASHNPKEPQLA